ncbi:hypothetical protein HanPSC8_Chr02g0076141 [Helianthus annuus]|nr:hypothetical protein HanPSC8_Chr02g0076141 [Helianthus annuus]
MLGHGSEEKSSLPLKTSSNISFSDSVIKIKNVNEQTVMTQEKKNKNERVKYTDIVPVVFQNFGFGP